MSDPSTQAPQASPPEGASAQVPPAWPRRPRRKSFAEQSFGDMVRSVLVLLLIIAAVGFTRSLVTDDDQARPVQAVDYSGQLQAARDRADYPVLAPRALGSGWVPTSVDLQSTGGSLRWHLGFLTPRREYVGLEQGDADPTQIVQTYTGGLRPVGAVTVAGDSWRLYRGEPDTALVRREGDTVTVVVGTASTEVLTSFAEALA